MDGIILKLRGAWNIIVANLFFDKSGQVSIVKTLAIVAFVALSLWLIPGIVVTLVKIAGVLILLYLAWLVIYAMINGNLDKASKI